MTDLYHEASSHPAARELRTRARYTRRVACKSLAKSGGVHALYHCVMFGSLVWLAVLTVQWSPREHTLHARALIGDRMRAQLSASGAAGSWAAVRSLVDLFDPPPGTPAQALPCALDSPILLRHIARGADATPNGTAACFQTEGMVPRVRGLRGGEVEGLRDRYGVEGAIVELGVLRGDPAAVGGGVALERSSALDTLARLEQAGWLASQRSRAVSVPTRRLHAALRAVWNARANAVWNARVKRRVSAARSAQVSVELSLRYPPDVVVTTRVLLEVDGAGLQSLFLAAHAGRALDGQARERWRGHTYGALSLLLLATVAQGAAEVVEYRANGRRAYGRDPWNWVEGVLIVLALCLFGTFADAASRIGVRLAGSRPHAARDAPALHEGSCALRRARRNPHPPTLPHPPSLPLVLAVGGLRRAPGGMRARGRRRVDAVGLRARSARRGATLPVPHAAPIHARGDRVRLLPAARAHAAALRRAHHQVLRDGACAIALACAHDHLPGWRRPRVASSAAAARASRARRRGRPARSASASPSSEAPPTRAREKGPPPPAPAPVGLAPLATPPTRRRGGGR